MVPVRPADAQTNLIVNGGFETGIAAPWVFNGADVANNGFPHTGTYLLWLGGAVNWSDSAYQTVSIPLAISSAQLSFYYNIAGADTNTTPKDTFTATIQDTNGAVLATVGNWSNANRDPGAGNPYYHQQTFDLTSYAGKTIRIAFASQNNATLSTSFFVDDVSIQTTAATGPADLLPQNVAVMPNPAMAGGLVTVSYNVANIGGTTSAASHTKISIIDSANNVLNQQIFATMALGPAATTNEIHTLSLAGAVAGAYSVVVAVDCNGEVSQTNRSNDVSAPTTLTVQPPAGLVIHPIYDASITSDPNAMKITNTINAAITAYEILFSDPITVNIQFSKMTNGLGESTTYTAAIAYSDFIAALADDSMTTNDAVALNYLPTGTSNPVNGDSDITLTTANFRALGIDIDPPKGQPDSYIDLNFSIMNLTRFSTDPTKYDLMSVVQHEMDEALALTSALNDLTNGAPAPTDELHVMDLFRYSPTDGRSFDTSTNTQAYFSIDGGTTDLVRFNQIQNADFQDWYSGPGHTPRIQDAFGTPGATPELNVELTALDVCGYNLVSAVPTPDIITMWPSAGTMTITWASQPNLMYQMQCKTNMLGTWFNVGNPVTAAGSTTSASAAMTSTQSFYRVVLETGVQSPAIRKSVINKAEASMSSRKSAMHAHQKQ